MNTIINRLNSLSISISCFCSDRCKNEGIKQMKALASANNLDYTYYEKTGFWREIRAEPEAETAHCDTCNVEIKDPKQNQRFCSQKCKNKFHNSKSK